MEPLYGRGELLARARLSVERARAGAGRLLLFTGEPGIGKSRLAEQVAREAADGGATVAFGRCWEAGGAPAYWPWIEVFRSLQMNEDPFAGADSDLAVAAPEARFAAFDRAVQKLRALSAQTPLTLVLDDLHAADPPSLLLLLLLARELPRSAILVLGAYRDTELQFRPEIAGLLAKIAREAEVLPLPRLASEDVAIWLQDAELGRDQSAELGRLTEGHPLFVGELLRTLEEEGSSDRRASPVRGRGAAPRTRVGESGGLDPGARRRARRAPEPPLRASARCFGGRGGAGPGVCAR